MDAAAILGAHFQTAVDRQQIFFAPVLADDL